MKEVYDVFGQFGIGAEAATVYLAILKVGTGTVSDIARITDLPRSSVERYVEELTDRGFLDFFIQKKRRIIVAKPPEHIKGLLEQRIARFEEVIPTLHQNASLAREPKSRVYFYEDLKGIKKIYEDMLNEQRPIDAITSPDDTYKTLGATFHNYFVNQRVAKKIPMRLLAPRSELMRKFRETDSKSFRTTIPLVTSVPFHTATYIYGDKVAFVSLRSENPSGVLVHDPLIAHTQRLSFGFLWERS